MLTQEYLKTRINYDPITGIITWRKRAEKLNEKGWNGRYAGKVSGYIANLSSKHYILLSINNKRFLAHRLAYLYMVGVIPPDEIDHINGNGLDNSWVNLRAVDKEANNKNMKLFCTNMSGISGVSRHKASKKWRARIHHGNREIYLGIFDCKSDAVNARRNAEVQYNYHSNHVEPRPLFGSRK